MKNVFIGFALVVSAWGCTLKNQSASHPLELRLPSENFATIKNCSEKFWPNLTYGKHTVIFYDSDSQQGEVIVGSDSVFPQQTIDSFRSHISQHLEGSYSIVSFEDSGVPLPVVETSTTKLNEYFEQSGFVDVFRKSVACLQISPGEEPVFAFPCQTSEEQAALMAHEHMHAFDQVDWSFRRASPPAEGPEVSSDERMKLLFYRMNLTAELERALADTQNTELHLQNATFWHIKFEESADPRILWDTYAADIQEGTAQYVEALAEAALGIGCDSSLHDLTLFASKVLSPRRQLLSSLPSIDSYFGGAYAALILARDNVPNWQHEVSDGLKSPIEILLTSRVAVEAPPRISEEQIACLYREE